MARVSAMTSNLRMSFTRDLATNANQMVRARLHRIQNAACIIRAAIFHTVQPIGLLTLQVVDLLSRGHCLDLSQLYVHHTKACVDGLLVAGGYGLLRGTRIAISVGESASAQKGQEDGGDDLVHDVISFSDFDGIKAGTFDLLKLCRWVL
jgi:hypothetical protein